MWRHCSIVEQDFLCGVVRSNIALVVSTLASVPVADSVPQEAWRAGVPSGAPAIFVYLGRPKNARRCPIIGLVTLPKVAVSDSGAGDLLTTPALFAIFLREL